MTVYSESCHLEMIWKQDNINQIPPSVTLTTSEFPQNQYSAAIESLEGTYDSISSHYHYSFNGLILKEEERKKKNLNISFLKLKR